MANIRKIIPNTYPLMLAPMENVTNSTFRTLCKKFGADIVYSEFISADALIRDVQKSIDKISFQEVERPIGIQIFGQSAQDMAEAAKIIESFNPDFIDLNFGCPVKKVVAKGGGAALLKDIPKMLEITKAVADSVKIPVTVKTRLGWDEKSKPIVELSERLQDAGAAAITIHCRTRAQMYKGTADWTLIGEVKNNPRMAIPVFGNGDIDSPDKAFEMKTKYGVDGLMIGRASVGNPWIFKQIHHFFNTGKYLDAPDINERVEICKEYLSNEVEIYGERNGILLLRKHYTKFFKGFKNFKNTRLKLLTSNSMSEALDILESIKK